VPFNSVDLVLLFLTVALGVFRTLLGVGGRAAARGPLLWRPTARHALASPAAAVVALGQLANVSEFLHFQF
jgi:hypothetical protein